MSGRVLEGRWSFWGTWVNPFTMDTFLSTVGDAVRQKERTLIVNHNVNSLAWFRRSRLFRALYAEGDYCFIDGAPVGLIARLNGWPVTRSNRIAVLDWFWPLGRLAAREGWTVAHLGADDKTIDIARRRIAAREPRLDLRLRDGYFDPDDQSQNAEILEWIRLADPDVLLIGMGMPRQERWVLRNLDDLPSCVIITVGGALGYVGGSRPTPPRWLGPLGVEWVFRLFTEPSRLWRRYLLEPLPLLPLFVADLARATARKVGLRV